MNKNGWTQKELDRLVKRYIDETGVQDFLPPDVAEWAKQKGYTMPDPPTDVEVLSMLLQKAVTSAKRKDRKVQYRAILSYPAQVLGEWKNRHFDMDGPAATVEKIIKSVLRRKEVALNILASCESTLDRARRLFPTQQQQLTLDLGITGDEAKWRALGRIPNEEDRQA